MQFWNFQTSQARRPNESGRSTKIKRIFPEKSSLYFSRSQHNWGVLTRRSRCLRCSKDRLVWPACAQNGHTYANFPYTQTPHGPRKPSYCRLQQECTLVIGVWLSWPVLRRIGPKNGPSNIPGISVKYFELLASGGKLRPHSALD